MNRRKFLAAFAAFVAGSPIGARAQQAGKVYRLAIAIQAGALESMTESGSNPYFPSFFEEMRRRGYEEGRNLVVERWTGEGRADRYEQIAREAVARNPDVILTTNNATALRLKEATTRIPIVAMVADPVGYKLAESLARPGGNVTGLSMQLDIVGKYLDLLRELKPSTKKVGFLASIGTWESAFGLRLKELASAAGISLVGPPMPGPFDESEYRRVLAEMVALEPDGIIVPPSAEHFPHRELIVQTIARARVPDVYPLVEYAKLGGLIVYAHDNHAGYRRAAEYVDRILKGANPAEMPFYENTKYDLIINMKTARQLGIEVPLPLLGRADEVIE